MKLIDDYVLEQFPREIAEAFRSTKPDDVLSGLRKAAQDSEVGIPIIPVGEVVAGIGLHAALVTGKVSPHFHVNGWEIYHAGGNGLMYLGDVDSADGKVTVVWKEPIEVEPGDEIAVAPGQAHCLVSTGGPSEPIFLIFACPENHLENTGDGDGDRVMLDDLPPGLIG